MGGVSKVFSGLVNTVMGKGGQGYEAVKAAEAAKPVQQTQAYSASPELRGTEQDAQNAIDFQNNASRRRASGSGAQMLASSGTTGSNAGTKTLLGS